VSQEELDSLRNDCLIVDVLPAEGPRQTMCDMGNINGCPRYPACGCAERLVKRLSEQSEGREKP
jgi:hypothetical protein